MGNLDRRENLTAADVLNFVAAGLGGLPHRIGRIEALAAPLARAAPQDGELRVALQDLDHIRQTVEDLARLATEAGSGASHSAGTLAATLRLEVLRELLVGSGQDMAPRKQDERAAGRIEFFAGGPDAD